MSGFSGARDTEERPLLERELMGEAIRLTQKAIKRAGGVAGSVPDIDLERELMGQAQELIVNIRRPKP